MKKIALVGNPNSGKTTLFNTLTKQANYTGNWPGVTVEKKEGIYSKNNIKLSIIDLPGVYSLSPYTEEEIITRNYLIEENVDLIINVVDSTNLSRNLYLTTELMEIDIPVIVALNMTDSLEKNKETIDPNILSNSLNLPVTFISYRNSESVDSLMQLAFNESQKERIGHSILSNTKLKNIINDVYNHLKDSISSPLFHAIRFIENDEYEVKSHPELNIIVDKYKKKYVNIDDRFEDYYIPNAKYNYIEKECLKALTINHNKKTITEKLDKVFTNKYLSIPIFIGILFLIFHFTFSSNLFFLKGIIEGIKGSSITLSFQNTIFEGVLYNEDGINSIGIIFQVLIENVFTYLKGLLETALMGQKEWVQGLIIDAALSSIFSIFSFLPQILLLFFFFSFLEDSGYMNRVVFIFDRLFKNLGLTGRSILPLIMGFGCSVPAIMNTRSLSSIKEKTNVIRVIPFFSCGAKLPILSAISGALVLKFGFKSADLITFSFYLIGMAIAIISLLIINRLDKNKSDIPFIMELPNYHFPNFKDLFKHLWDKLKHFVIKAFTVILASSIVIYFLSHFSFTFEYLDAQNINNSILSRIGSFLEILFTPLGFGKQLNGYGYIFIVAAITGIIAKENVVATISTLSIYLVGITSIENGETSSLMALIEASGIGAAGLISFVLYNLTTIPCISTIITAKNELPKGKFLGTIVFWLMISYVVSALAYLCISYLYVLIIVISLVIISIVLSVIFRRNKHELS